MDADIHVNFLEIDHIDKPEFLQKFLREKELLNMARKEVKVSYMCGADCLSVCRGCLANNSPVSQASLSPLLFNVGLEFSSRCLSNSLLCSRVGEARSAQTVEA